MTDLDRLLAIADIRSLKARYWHAVDRRDAAALRSVFAPDAVIPAHGDVAETRSADAFVDHLIRSLKGAASLHLGGPGDIAIFSDTDASGVWAMEDRIWAPAAGSALPFRTLHGWGHYHDQYRRTEAGWKIQSFILERVRVETT